MISIKKKAQKLDPLVTNTLRKSDASYEKLMLEMMSSLVTETKKNSTIIGQHFSHAASPQKKLPRFLKDVSNQQSFHKPKGQFSPRSPKNEEHSIIIEVEQSHSGTNIVQKSLKTSPSTQQLHKTTLSSDQEQLKPQQESKIQKVLVNLEKRLKASQQINQKLVQTIQNFQTHTLQLGKPKKEEVKRKSAEMQNILIEKLIQNPHNDEHEKNSYNILSQILPHSDRRQIKIKFRLTDIITTKNNSQNSKDLVTETSEWLGMVYRATASICWNMLLNNYLSFDEVKILFTENIVFNYITLMNELEDLGYQSQRQSLTNLINIKSVDILDFLCKQYPQTKIQAPNMALRDILPPIENSGKIKYEIVSRSAVKFTYDQDGDYTPQIMRMINYMIHQSNEEYHDFYQCLKGTFEQIFYPINKRNKSAQERQEHHEDVAYRQKAKSYTKYLIGRKISKNTAKYSEEEIQDGVFFVKSSGVLRIITKWVQELMEYIQQPEDKIKNSYNENKDHLGNSIYISSFIKNALYKEVIKGKKKLLSKIEDIKRQCYKMELLLTMEQFTTDHTQIHLSQEQINVGMFCSNLKSAISSYICAQLNEIIHFLLKIPQEVNLQEYISKQTSQSQAATFATQAKKDLDSVNLITFKIFDLLRCKIHSNQEEIIWIVKELLSQSEKNKDKFNIVRIKDRLHLGTRDIMINAQINKGLVCEIQLAVTSQTDKKQELLDSYNHFLYELKRSKLGPLTENVSIWSTLEQRYSYFEILRKKKMKEQIQKQSRQHKCGNDHFQIFKRPIICLCCKNFFAIPKTCLLNVSCQQCKETICGECYYYNYLNSEERKLYIFDQNKLFKNDIMSKLKEYTDFQKAPFPSTGFFIKKNFLKKELSFYMAVQKDKVQGVKDNPNSELLVIQTVLRGQQIINRQLNKNQIEARVQNGQFFIKRYHKTQVKNYIIFYFEKEHKKMMKLSEIQAELKTEERRNTKVLNILKQPCYINNLKLLKKQNEKLRELNYLKKIVGQKKIVVYKFKNLFILGQVCVSGKQLRAEITKKLNLGSLKSFINKQSDIISMENKKLTNEFEELPAKINENVFRTFATNLKKLFLANGLINSMKSFSVFSNVQFIVISDNKLQNLQGVQNLKKLAYLRFDGNNISSLEPLLLIDSLKSIYANKNQIKSLTGIQNQKELKVLSVYNNNIQSIKELQNLTFLLQLYLKNNPIEDLSPVSNLKNLNKLFLGENKATVLPNLNEMKDLRYLSLQGLQLEEIPQFSSLIKLQELHLGHNKIKSINTNICSQTDLTLLNLSYNQIEKIQNLCQLNFLQVLKVADNKITVLRGLKNIDSLKRLNAKNNSIDDIGQLLQFQVTFSYQFSQEMLSERAKKQLTELQNYKTNVSESDE